jgi:hypothetical protein
MILRALETPMTVERLSYGFPDIERGTDTKVKRALVLLFHLRAVAFAS